MVIFPSYIIKPVEKEKGSKKRTQNTVAPFHQTGLGNDRQFKKSTFFPLFLPCPLFLFRLCLGSDQMGPKKVPGPFILLYVGSGSGQILMDVPSLCLYSKPTQQKIRICLHFLQLKPTQSRW